MHVSIPNSQQSGGRRTKLNANIYFTGEMCPCPLVRFFALESNYPHNLSSFLSIIHQGCTKKEISRPLLREQGIFEIKVQQLKDWGTTGTNQLVLVTTGTVIN
jgi:hypothetical protein